MTDGGFNMNWSPGGQNTGPNNSNGNLNNWGSPSTVGYSPGQVGYVPADWSKYTFQKAQYEQMYGKRDRALFARIPIAFATIISPATLLCSYHIFIIAWNFCTVGFSTGASLEPGPTPPLSPVEVMVGVIWFLVTWVVAGYCIYRLTLAIWITALMLHRRLKGDSTAFSRSLAFLDQAMAEPIIVKQLDRDYPYDPTMTSRDFYPYQ